MALLYVPVFHQPRRNRPESYHAPPATFLIGLVVFILPWQEMAVFEEIGPLAKLFGYVVVATAGFYVIVTLQIRKPPAIFIFAVLFIGWACASLLWAFSPEDTLGHAITWAMLLIFFWLGGSSPILRGGKGG